MLQRHVSYHWTTSQERPHLGPPTEVPSRRLFKEQTIVLAPGKRAAPERLPGWWNKSLGASQISSGLKDGINGRAATRQGGYFGSGLDEPASQTSQLRPPRENDFFEVILGRTPTLRGKMWPRAESCHSRGSTSPCQPQTRLAVRLRGGGAVTGKNHEAVTPWKISEWINLFPVAAAEHAAAQQKERNVRPKLGGQLPSSCEVHPVARQAFQSEERDGCVAASASETTPHRDPLYQLDANSSRELPRSPPELAGSINEILPPRRHRGVVALNNDSPGLVDGNVETIVEC